MSYFIKILLDDIDGFFFLESRDREVKVVRVFVGGLWCLFGCKCLVGDCFKKVRFGVNF